jgi:hypothetical protein
VLNLERIGKPLPEYGSGILFLDELKAHNGEERR